MAAILGHPDGEAVDRDDMLAAIARIVAAVDVGVSADVEAGYGDTESDAASVAERVLAAGVVGLNLQDTGNPAGRWAGRLAPIERAVAKIAAVRGVAQRAGVPLVINARTDTFLQDGDQVGGAIVRGNAYLAAGADCVFAPGVVDARDIARLVAGLDGPLNIYAGPGTPPVAELESLGVRRVSIGCGPYQACLALVDRVASELLVEGRYDAFTLQQLALGELTELLMAR